MHDTARSTAAGPDTAAGRDTGAVALADLAVDQPHRVVVDGVPVCVVRTADDRVRALHDTCSHQEASLADGMVWGDEVECPLHGAAFDLDTGRPSSLPATTAVPTYAVTVEDGAVHVDVGAPTNDAPVPDHD